MHPKYVNSFTSLFNPSPAPFHKHNKPTPQRNLKTQSNKKKKGPLVHRASIQLQENHTPWTFPSLACKTFWIHSFCCSIIWVLSGCIVLWVRVLVGCNRWWRRKCFQKGFFFYFFLILLFVFWFGASAGEHDLFFWGLVFIPAAPLLSLVPQKKIVSHKESCSVWMFLTQTVQKKNNFRTY